MKWQSNGPPLINLRLELGDELVTRVRRFMKLDEYVVFFYGIGYGAQPSNDAVHTFSGLMRYLMALSNGLNLAGYANYAWKVWSSGNSFSFDSGENNDMLYKDLLFAIMAETGTSREDIVARIIDFSSKKGHPLPRIGEGQIEYMAKESMWLKRFSKTMSSKRFNFLNEALGLEGEVLVPYTP